VILLDQDLLPPGGSGYAQLRLAEPMLLVSGDPYLLRIASPAATIGGGIVLDPFPPARRRRNSEALSLLASLDAAEHLRTCALIVTQSLLSGVSLEEIVLRSGIPRKQTEAALQNLLASGEILQMTREPRIFLSAGAVDILKKQLLTSWLHLWLPIRWPAASARRNSRPASPAAATSASLPFCCLIWKKRGGWFLTVTLSALPHLFANPCPATGI